MKSIYVGIDISKNTLDFCIKSSNGISFQKIDNKIRNIRMYASLKTELFRSVIILNFKQYETKQIHTYTDCKNFKGVRQR